VRCTRSPAATQATSTAPKRAARTGATSLPPGHRPPQPRACRDHKGSRACRRLMRCGRRRGCRCGGLQVGQPVPQGAATEVETCGFTVGPRQRDRRPPVRRRGRWRCATADGRADPLYFQYRAYRGACGKPWVMPYNRWQRPEPTDKGVTTCMCCCRRMGPAGTSNRRWGSRCSRCRCGDVESSVGLAVQVRARGAAVRVCAPLAPAGAPAGDRVRSAVDGGPNPARPRGARRATQGTRPRTSQAGVALMTTGMMPGGV